MSVLINTLNYIANKIVYPKYKKKENKKEEKIKPVSEPQKANHIDVSV